MYVVFPKPGVTSTNPSHHVKLFSKKDGHNFQQLYFLHIFGLHFKNSSQSIPLSLPFDSMNNFFKQKLGLHPIQKYLLISNLKRHTQVDKVRSMFKFTHLHKPV